MARCRQLLALALLVSHGVVDARKIVLDPSLPCPASCRANLPPVTILASSYISTVEHAVIGTLYSTVRNSSTFATCKAHGTRTCHTMLTPYTLRNFGAAIERVIVDRVPGDVMELGVWRGGGTMYAKALLAVYGEEERARRHRVVPQGEIGDPRLAEAKGWPGRRTPDTRVESVNATRKTPSVTGTT